MTGKMDKNSYTKGINIQSVFLIFIVFFSIINDTLLKSQFIRDITYFLWAILLLICFFEFLGSSKVGIKQSIYFISLFILTIISLYIKNNYLWYILMFSVYASFFSAYDFIKKYFIAVSVSLLFLILCVISGALPFSYNGSITLGYSNANGPALLIFLLVVNYYFLSSNKFTWYNLLIFVVTELLEYIVFDDITAAILLIVYVLFVFISEHIKLNKFIVLLGSMTPFLLFFISLYLVQNYYRSNWIYKLNELLSYRVSLWLNYMTNYPPKMFPQVILDMNAPLDSAYMYYLIHYGYVEILFICAILSLATYKIGKNNSKNLFILFIVLEIYSFSEVSPFYSGLCYLLPLSFSMMIKKAEFIDNRIDYI